MTGAIVIRIVVVAVAVVAIRIRIRIRICCHNLLAIGIGIGIELNLGAVCFLAFATPRSDGPHSGLDNGREHARCNSITILCLGCYCARDIDL